MNLVELALVPILGGIVGFAVWYLQSSLESVRREKENLQNERRKIYEDVLEPFIRIFAGINDPAQTQAALEQVQSYEYRRRIMFELNMMGSDEVVVALNNMMQHIYRTEEVPSDPVDMLRHWGRLLIAIRKDLGSENTKLEEVDMLRGQIKDIDQYYRIKSGGDS